MARRRRRRFATLVGMAIAVALTAAGSAGADGFPAWSGTKGPFAWEAKRLSCGNVGDAPSRVRAHTRWRTSPANGYLRLTFRRQLWDDVAGAWTTVHEQRRSTKNTRLEGARNILHWSQWFFPFEEEGGALSRHAVVFEWRRDRPGRDALSLRRTRMMAPCTVSAR